MHKILIVGPSWVGDMVMSHSLIITLKQLHPDAEIDVLAPAWSKPIINRMPEVGQAIEMPIGHGSAAFKERRGIGKALRQKNYTWSIVLPNSWKSALIPWFANIPRRTGWKGEMRYGLINDLRHLDKQALPKTVQLFVSLAYDAAESKSGRVLNLDSIPKPSLQASHKRQQQLIEKFQLLAEERLLVLCPGAEFGPAKQWPSHYYRSIAEKKSAEGWQVWVLGSDGDREFADEVCGTSNNSITNLCGKTTLDEAIDLMSLAKIVISNDSGLMHIASALNMPLVALYGATSPDFTPPLADNAEVLSVEVDCGPCFKRECPMGHHKCMMELTPKKVDAVIHSLS